jgi:phage-related protein
MPPTPVVFFVEDDGDCPLLAWLDALAPKVQIKCIVRIERLAQLGHELRRPEADLLQGGIHELRLSWQSANYRVLYFFHQQTAVLSHGCIKQRQVPTNEIDRAIRNMRLFQTNPEKHTYQEGESDE